jgi:rSAM/selenodomain-associated transferase 1
LARDIGKAAALRVYRQLLDYHRREFRQADFDVEWRYTPARAPFRRLARNCRAQPTGNLGERMRVIFAESFARGYRRVVMIGTDAPTMNRATVRAAFRLLGKHRAVFQPTEDGGYALIGLREMVDVFSNMPWSSDRLMAETRKRVACAELPVTFDIDTAADLAQYSSRRSKKTSRVLPPVLELT